MKKVKFSVFTHWISNLGKTKAKSYHGFNLVVIIYTIFNLYFVNNIQRFFITDFQSILSFVFFGAYSAFLILILLYPQNINFKIHRRLSDLLFISLFSGLVLLFLAHQNIFLAITLITGILLGYSFALMYAKYKEIPKTLIKVRETEKSILIRNSCFLEWLFFLLVVSNQILLSVT